MKNSEERQFYKPYDSTISFYNLLIQLNLINKKTRNVIDIGTGIGANLKYFSSRSKHINFLGTDYNQNALSQAIKKNKNPKINFKKLNILKSVKSFKDKFDGLTCIHTLCCFKNQDEVIKNFCKINPKWIAINSLFYEGPLDVLIHIRDHSNLKIKDNNPNSDFNIFSLPKTIEIFKKNGYKIIKKHPYFPKKKLTKPKKGARGSYTMKTDLSLNTTFSGPVHLPWYFVVAIKK